MTNRKEQSMERDSLGHRNSSCIRNRKHLAFSNLVMVSIRGFEEMKRVFHDRRFVTTYTMMKQHVYKEQSYLYLQCISFRKLTLSQQDKNFSDKCGFKCPGGKKCTSKNVLYFPKSCCNDVAFRPKRKLHKCLKWKKKKSLKLKEEPKQTYIGENVAIINLYILSHWYIFISELWDCNIVFYHILGSIKNRVAFTGINCIFWGTAEFDFNLLKVKIELLWIL